MTRKKHITWENTYKFPLVKDPEPYCTYVWTTDNGMALTFNREIEKEEYNKVVDTLNGLDSIKYPNLNYNNGDMYDGDKFLFTIRGWGHLTSKLKLSNEEASEIQDNFAEFIKQRLS